jgi:hypothetical protein
MKRPFAVAAALLALSAAPLVVADHMSPDGIGTAGMPNDIHNTRLDVRLSDAPNTCFTDLVQQGDLADVDNRCDSDDPTDCVVYTVTTDCDFVTPD